VTPRNARATRAARLGELLRGRAAGYALGLGIVGALVAGAALRSALVMVVAPVAVAVLVVALAVRTAGKRAASDFFSAFAAGHDFTYHRDWQLPPLTPLLGAGDRRHWEHFMTGPLGAALPGLDCGLGLYTYETRTGSDDDSNGHWRSHHFTACVVDMEGAMVPFPALFLQRRRDLVGHITEEEWLNRHGRQTVELESVEFRRRYELLADGHMDQLALRELFSPSFIVFLAGHPIAPCFEYRAATLAVYVRGRLTDAGSLNLLLDATRGIATRLREEAAEQSRTAAAATT
jgi:hypothetical protein